MARRTSTLRRTRILRRTRALSCSTVVLAAGLALAGCGDARTASVASSGTRAEGEVGTAATASASPGAAGAPAVPGPQDRAGVTAETRGPAGRSPDEVGDEEYDRRASYDETDPARTPTSTFATDVDTASYGYARSLLERGERPSPEQVRPEEFVNAFRQDYPQPRGDGFTVTADGARLPAVHRDRPSDDLRLLRVGLQTRDDDAPRPDAALTFVIDVSGSMAEPGKLDLVKRSLHTLVDTIRPTDSVAVVTFDDVPRVLRPMTRVSQRSVLHAAIDELGPGGSTNLADGLVTGYRVAREGFRPGATNRVVLLSDAVANVGDTEAAPILARVREAAAKQITLLGVGVGNDYGDQLMEQLADSGDGFVVYVSDEDSARRAFVETLPVARSVRALDAKVQVTFDPRTVAGYRLIGYANRALARQDFRDDRVDGGEVAAGHSVTALYVVRLRDGARGQVAHTQLRWQDPRTHEADEAGADVTTADLDRQLLESAPRLQVSYAAAFFAEQLRHDPSATGLPDGYLARIADAAADRTEDPAVRELARLIRRTDG